MSTQQPTGAPVALPALSDDRIDEIEDALFADIARERSSAQARRTRRGRLWMAGGAAAAIVAVAAIIAPNVVPLVGGAGGGSADYAVAPDAAVQTDGDAGGATEESTADRSDLSTEPGAAVMGDDTTAEREIITTASATVSVDDVTSAARTIGNSAVAHDGYVESMSIGTNGVSYPVDPQTGIAYDTMPYPYTPDGAWISIRVPSGELPAVIEELSDVGEVTASSVNRQDVTEQTVDLRARIEAAQASVDRLIDLMGEATNVADLIAAEAALSERQALLESYQQQLEMLEDQVAMSSLTVTLSPVVETVEADPAGFADGLIAGWNGLVATLNGIVIALGFLIPWLAVVALAGLVVWVIVRAVRGRRANERDRGSVSTSSDAAPPSD